MNGQFISFEGPDGAGKTTVLKAMVAYFEKEISGELVVTREPGGNPISEAIRKLILDPQNTMMDRRTEALLYAAARRQHLVEKVIPALQRDAVVFCDRYVDSSVAYQGAGRKIGTDDVYKMNLFATEGILPNLTIYLDVPSEVGLRRIMNHRQNEINRLDLEKLDFHKRVREAYLALAKQYPDRIKVINANQEEKVVQHNVRILLEEQLHSRLRG